MDADAPDDVCTVTAIAPGVAAPMVKPLIVTVNTAVEALMAAPDVVSTSAMLLAAPRAMLRPGTLLSLKEATGATEDAMKLEGYVRVMMPPERKTEVTGKHAIVGVALACPAMRSEGEIVKTTAEIEPIMHISDRPIKTKGETQAT